MPKILVNEIDKTSPGAPNDYVNYAVLIAGFCDKATLDSTSKKPVSPDENGIYEFKSADDFDKTVGLVAPAVTEQIDNGQRTVKHYGNQMAYELLKIGYPVIYKPLDSTKTATDAIKAMTDSSFWEIFKDKASYDFRFISHGLLSSTDLSTNANYIALNNRLDDLNEASDLLKVIGETEKDATKQEEAFQKIRNTSDGFVAEGETDAYDSYADAVQFVGAEKEAKEAAIKEIENDIVTSADFIKINSNIADIATYVSATDEDTTEIPGRGDCIALVEIDELEYSGVTVKPENAIISAIAKMKSDIGTALKGKYCAVTVPSVTYIMADNEKFGKNKTFPGAFHYLACFKNSLDHGFAEWYAAAGYTRGVSSYTVDYTTVKLGEIAINALEPRKTYSGGPEFACNVIANFRGSYYLWGNRTAYPLDDKNLVASHFLNIRQLCTTIKKQLYVACRRFTFDPNSDTLWINFKNAIKPTLEAMKADQGIRDYRIVKENTDKKATLKAKIRIIPIEAVEDFDIEVYLEDSFGDTVVATSD